MYSHHLSRKWKSTAILCFDIDLAKNAFAIHGINEWWHRDLVRLKVARTGLHELISWLFGSQAEASELIRLAPVEVFEAGPVGVVT